MRISRFCIAGILILLFVSALAAQATRQGETINGGKLWMWSAITVSSAQALDISSSWGKIEMHPLLQSADGEFGTRGLMIKASVAGLNIALQSKAIKGRPKLKRTFIILNFATAATLSIMTARNFRIS